MYQKGDRVRHEEFGEGTVILVDNNCYPPISVEFDNPNESQLHDGSDDDHKGGKPFCCYWFDEDDKELRKIGG